MEDEEAEDILRERVLVRAVLVRETCWCFVEFEGVSS